MCERYWSVRPACLCPNTTRHRRQRGSARGQMQKSSSVGKRHKFRPVSSRNARLEAVKIVKRWSWRRLPIAPVLPVAMTGISAHPLAAWIVG
jgi:hypothetical protein